VDPETSKARKAEHRSLNKKIILEKVRRDRFCGFWIFLKMFLTEFLASFLFIFSRPGFNHGVPPFTGRQTRELER
jgi:hypothetical protein